MGQIDELWRYDGRRVVVTGFASGIGACVARQLTELGGGLLIGTSYWTIKRGVSNLLDATGARSEAGRRVPRWRIALQLAGRYALLGFMAYVMIARLRLPPLWLLAGASSIVAAVAVEAARFLVKKS